MKSSVYLSKTALAKEAIERGIMSGTYASGERFNVRELASALGMSATPVREALRILQASGLVAYDEHKTISVVGLVAEDVGEVYSLRMNVEGLAAEWAAERRTASELEEVLALQEKMAQSVATGDEEGARSDNYAWHFAVYRASHGKYLMGMITQLWVQADWPAIWGVPGQLEKSVIEHDKVSRAIQHGDGKTAGLYMSQHINRGMEMVLDMIDLGDDDG